MSVCKRILATLNTLKAVKMDSYFCRCKNMYFERKFEYYISFPWCSMSRHSRTFMYDETCSSQKHMQCSGLKKKKKKKRERQDF